MHRVVVRIWIVGALLGLLAGGCRGERSAEQAEEPEEPRAGATTGGDASAGGTSADDVASAASPAADEDEPLPPPSGGGRHPFRGTWTIERGPWQVVTRGAVSIWPERTADGPSEPVRAPSHEVALVAAVHTADGGWVTLDESGRLIGRAGAGAEGWVVELGADIEWATFDAAGERLAWAGTEGIAVVELRALASTGEQAGWMVDANLAPAKESVVVRFVESAAHGSLLLVENPTHLLALEPGAGGLVWHLPAPVGVTLAVAARRTLGLFADGSSVAVLDFETGALGERLQIVSDEAVLLAAHGERLAFTVADRLYVVGADGRFPASPAQLPSRPESLWLAGSHVALVFGSQLEVRPLDAPGTVAWQRESSGVVQQATDAGVFVVGADDLLALDERSGELVGGIGEFDLGDVWLQGGALGASVYGVGWGSVGLDALRLPLGPSGSASAAVAGERFDASRHGSSLEPLREAFATAPLVGSIERVDGRLTLSIAEAGPLVVLDEQEAGVEDCDGHALEDGERVLGLFEGEIAAALVARDGELEGISNPTPPRLRLVVVPAEGDCPTVVPLGATYFDSEGEALLDADVSSRLEVEVWAPAYYVGDLLPQAGLEVVRVGDCDVRLYLDGQLGEEVGSLGEDQMPTLGELLELEEEEHYDPTEEPRDCRVTVERVDGRAVLSRHLRTGSGYEHHSYTRRQVERSEVVADETSATGYALRPLLEWSGQTVSGWRGAESSSGESAQAEWRVPLGAGSLVLTQSSSKESLSHDCTVMDDEADRAERCCVWESSGFAHRATWVAHGALGERELTQGWADAPASAPEGCD